jgi:hypothetical protein
MKTDAGSETLIRRYLLAAVSEEEREQVETRIMTDDAYYHMVDLIEDELTDQYLDNDLSVADRRHFEESFLCASERQQKLRFAKALRLYASRTAPSPEPEPVLTRFLRQVSTLLSPPRLVWTSTFALTLIVGTGLVLYRISGLRNQVSGLQALQRDSSATASHWQSLFFEQQAKVARLSGQIREEQELRTRSQPVVSPPVAQLALLNPPPFLLSPGVQRGIQPVTRIVLPRSAVIVSLILDLPENAHRTYRAVLLNEGQELLSRSLLKASESTERITVCLNLPATDLSGGDYRIKLYGSGEQEPVSTYIFRLSRK